MPQNKTEQKKQPFLKWIIEWRLSNQTVKPSFQNGYALTLYVEVSGHLDPIQLSEQFLVSDKAWFAMRAAIEGREDVELRP